MRVPAIVAGTLVAAGIAVAAPAPAPARTPGLSAMWQYVEMVPTSSGPREEKPGSRPPAKLPAPASRAIGRSPGRESDVLRKVVTSPAYGAAQQPARAATPGGEAGEPSAPAASLADLADDGSLDALVGAMLLSLAVALAYRLAPLRRGERSAR